VAVGSCATAAREPGQGREAAAFSGTCRVPQGAWPSPQPADIEPAQGARDRLSAPAVDALVAPHTARASGDLQHRAPRDRVWAPSVPRSDGPAGAKEDDDAELAGCPMRGRVRKYRHTDGHVSWGFEVPYRDPRDQRAPDVHPALGLLRVWVHVGPAAPAPDPPCRARLPAPGPDRPKSGEIALSALLERDSATSRAPCAFGSELGDGSEQPRPSTGAVSTSTSKA
jgi:hypothetical protein